MSEMVEKVALAIGEKIAGAGTQAKGNWLIAARAAIAAMREPSPQMLRIALEESDEIKPDLAVRLLEAWKAMIDEALKDGGP